MPTPSPRPRGPWPQSCFLHIGKTGGTAVYQLLARQFPAERVLHLSADVFDDLAPGAADDFDHVTGHFSYRHLARFAPHRVAYTMVREPVARVHSTYWFLRNWTREVVDSNRDMLDAAKRYSLRDFLRDDRPQVRSVVWNQQTYALACDWRAARFGDGWNVLASALAHLDEFVVVGLQERSDESLARIFRALRWPPPPPLERANVTPDRPPLAELTAAERDAILDANRLDAILYDTARRRFDAALPLSAAA